MKSTLLLIMIAMSMGLSASEFRQLKIDCDNNIGSSCYSLAHLYSDEKDMNSALKIFKKGCELNHKRSCVGAGAVASELGYGEQVKKYYKEACDKGSSLGCEFLGDYYYKHGFYKKAIAPFKKACNSSNKQEATSCKKLADISKTVTDTRTETLSASEFTKAKSDCDNNIAKGCHTLGYVYFFEKKNEKEGLKAYHKATSLGYLKSYLAIAYIYNEKGDAKTEKKYLKKACNLGADLGCGLLGQKYFEQNKYQEASPLLQKACNSRTLDNKPKQDACEYLEDISKTVIGTNTDAYRNCLMTNKMYSNVGEICLSTLPKRVPSLLSEKNQRDFNKCLKKGTPVAMTMILSGRSEEACAIKLGLKFISTTKQPW